jgi:ABC-type hemin transport system substrate-binding protein
MTIQNKTGGLSAAGSVQECRPLKAELWTKRYPEIVVRTSVEEDVISNVRANSDRTRKSF